MTKADILTAQLTSIQANHKLSDGQFEAIQSCKNLVAISRRFLVEWGVTQKVMEEVANDKI